MVTSPSYVTLLPSFLYKVLMSSKDVGRNVCHGSDAVESAKKEIALWFKPEEVLEYKQAQHEWIYEK